LWYDLTGMDGNPQCIYASNKLALCPFGETVNKPY